MILILLRVIQQNNKFYWKHNKLWKTLISKNNPKERNKEKRKKLIYKMKICKKANYKNHKTMK